ncbi:condensation domain-containing protein, partial [Tahibacter aquaticus]|uniref:condensation domain-containing protein n=1 Tax=Tahibacter aquaticus TaxID=520092 RepID=UPI001FB76ADA
IQVTSRANQAGIGITTRQLFEAQTIAALAQCVQPQQQVERPQGAVQGALRLLPIQQQFLAGDALDKHHHNQAVLLQVPLQLQPEALRTAVAALYQRHDALRLRFVERDGQWQAQHQALDDAMLAASCVVETLPADAQEIAAFLTARCNHWQAGFDLAQGPLLRVVLFQGETTARLLLLAHHLVIDGVSWRILLADLEQAYRQIERGETVALAPKTSSLQQWGEALAGYAQSPALQQEKAYWLAQYRRPVPLLPADHAMPDGGEMAAAAHVGLRLSAEDTRALLQQCNRAYRTQINELLLAGVYLGLRRWSGEPGLRIALEGHGREALFDNLDLTETVGWFTSIYPLTLWQEDASVEAVIKATKEQYRSVPARGIGYGVLRHLAQDAELMAAEAGQWPELAFNYLGQSEQAVNEETFFQGSSESAGASASARRRRAHALVLKGMVAGGELRLSLEYPRERYERATMEQLAAHVEAALREVVEHCATRERAAFTPSDLPLAQVGQAQLDEWQARYPAMTRLYPATPMQAGLLFESLL